MTKDIVGMVLAGGRVDELSVLTAKRPKSALPMWGSYRIIDFALSNMMNSGIDVVGVLSQYRPYSLNEHLENGAPWDFVGRTRALKVLSPFMGEKDADWYKGTADAIYQNLTFLRHYLPKLVLIVAGDHVYSMDYRPLIRQHLATGAALTIALKRVPREQASSFGTAVLDADGRVLRYQEKSPDPESDLASLTVYVFDADRLLARLRENAAEGQSYQLYSEVIPRMVAEGERVFGYVFDGYWQYARSLASYFAANMDILSAHALDLEAWQVRTNPTAGAVGDPSPTLFRPSARVTEASIGPSCDIAGTVRRSVVSPGVIVERDAIVTNSIIMHSCRIGHGATVDGAILDKLVTIGPRARVGTADPLPLGHPDVATSGLVVVGKGSSLPAGCSIGRDCIVAPDVRAEQFPAEVIAAGSTVAP
jgi:glucose-1-phosphate adenylyltransferase